MTDFTARMAERIELWPTDRLVPYNRNPRTHSPEQVDKIAASIVEFGFLNPILVDTSDGIIAGHGRLVAAKKLSLPVVPVVVLDHLTEAQKRAYVIADNKLALDAGWDEGILAAEMHALNSERFDLALTGFDDDELDELLAPLEDEEEETAGGGEEADAVPQEAKRRVTRLGDVWQIGHHRLLCGDSADKQDIARLMNGEKAALLFTSPPYGNQREYTTGGIGDWDALMKGVFAAMPVREDAQILVNLGLIHRDNEWVPYWQAWIDWMRGQGWRRFGWYVWDQGPGLPGSWNGRFAPSFEFVFHFNKEIRKPNKIVPCKWAGHVTHEGEGGLRKKDGTVERWAGGEHPVQDMKIPDSVIRISRHKARGIETDHPAVFPIKLVRFALEAYSDEGDACYEPFSGSGTSIIAAEQTGRRMFASEIAPEYCDIALERCRDLFPDLAITLDGRDYEAVAQERLAG